MTESIGVVEGISHWILQCDIAHRKNTCSIRDVGEVTARPPLAWFHVFCSMFMDNELIVDNPSYIFFQEKDMKMEKNW